MADLSDLLSRVEQASGPDRELDGLLATRLMGWEYAQCSRPREGYVWRDETGCATDLMPLTASIDAALALVERKLPGWMVVNLCEWDHDVLRRRGPWTCILKERGTQDDITATKGHCPHAPTAPIAVVSALIRALISEPSNG